MNGTDVISKKLIEIFFQVVSVDFLFTGTAVALLFIRMDCASTRVFGGRSVHVKQAMLYAVSAYKIIQNLN